MVGQVDDLALPRPFDGGVRLVDETLQPFGKPVIAASLLELAVHSLLHYDPMAVVGDDEPVQIRLEAVLHSGTVDLCHQAAGGGEPGPVKAHLVTDLDQLVRRLPRIFSAPAADVNPELLLQRSQPALQRADNARRNAGGMPVHSHYGAERLKPERMSEATHQSIATVMMNNRLTDTLAKPGQP